MTEKIIPFKKPEEPKQRLLLVCTECNCMTHYIHDDKSVECANCGQDVTTGGELQLDVPAPPESPRINTNGNRVTNLGSPEAAAASVLGDIRRWHEGKELEVLVGYNKEGKGRSWFNFTTEADRAYILDRLEDVKEHVSKASVSEECTCGEKDEGEAKAQKLFEGGAGPEAG